MHPADITQLLQKLVNEGFLESHGAARATTYTLKGTPNIDLAEPFSSKVTTSDPKVTTSGAKVTTSENRVTTSGETLTTSGKILTTSEEENPEFWRDLIEKKMPGIY